MTVGRLKALLDAHPDIAIVVLSSDAKGNGFRPLDEISGQGYRDDWGEIQELQNNGRPPKGSKRAVVLWPKH